MHMVKRLEIIASSREMHKILEPLDEAKLHYSIIRDVIGRSSWGEVSDDSDFASTTLSNIYILSFCTEQQVQPVLERIRLVLNKFGGVCYLSDATEIQSLK